MQLLFINVKGYRFCLPLVELERLLLLMEIQSIPKAPEYLVGLMNLGGEAVPVLDLALRIGIEHEENYSVQTPVVLLNSKQQKTALIIDHIEGVFSVKQEQLRGERLFEGGLPPIKASITTANGMALLLDTQRILDFDLSGMGISLELSKELLALCYIKNGSKSQQNLGQYG
ncbi:MAG: chemotaxis protein CheW [Pseudomonadota bacterium]